MPRASEAPFALVDIVRCLKSRTTVDAGRCSQCSPTNGSPGRRHLDVPQAITKKKMCVDKQSWIAPQKPHHHAPYARFSGGRGFRRHLLSRYSVRAEVRDGETRRLRKCGSLGSGCGRTFFRFTEDSDIWTGRREAAENPRRRRDRRDSNGRNQFASTIKGSNSHCYVD